MEQESTALVRTNPREELIQILKNSRAGYASLPVITRLNEVGLSPREIEAIIDITATLPSITGQKIRTKHFLEAVVTVYGEEYLASLSGNFTRFSTFTDELAEMEELREGLRDCRTSASYRTLLGLIKSIGVERLNELYERVDGKKKAYESDKWRSIRALYQIREIVDESERSGYSPESILDLRTGELMWEDDFDEDFDEEDEYSKI